MVVLDDDVKLTDYEAVMQCLVKNIELSRDVFFTKGPVDVLDHASSAYAFGGKMGIDGTRKFPEELHPFTEGIEKTVDFTDLIEIIPIIKTISGQVKLDAEKYLQIPGNQPKKLLVFVEEFVGSKDYSTIIWRVFNNIDPARDCYFIGDVLVVDGTRKYAGIDGFNRPWPNCTVVDNATIGRIDSIWAGLGLGPIISSPSHKYSLQVYEGEAEAEKK